MRSPLDFPDRDNVESKVCAAREGLARVLAEHLHPDDSAAVASDLRRVALHEFRARDDDEAHLFIMPGWDQVEPVKPREGSSIPPGAPAISLAVAPMALLKNDWERITSRQFVEHAAEWFYAIADRAASEVESRD